MNGHRRAGSTIELTSIPSRRHVLRGLAALGLTLGAAVRPVDLEAKKKKKRKKKGKKREQPTPPPTSPPPPPPLPPGPNAYGCLSVNVPCTSAAECCTGICEGGVCRGHGAGTCKQDIDGICETDNPFAVLCDPSTRCACVETTGESRYCASLDVLVCSDCAKDADCLDLGFPAGTACAPFAAGLCTGRCQSGMACVTPCGTTADVLRHVATSQDAFELASLVASPPSPVKK